jgi:predicted Zn-dependent protease
MTRHILLVVLALTITSTVAQADPFKISQQEQFELGQRAANDVRKTEKVLPDGDVRTALIRKIGGKLLALYNQDDAKEKRPKPFKYTFDVIESPDVNAFAFPGGPTFFYTGLLDRMNTEDEVAAVLAHELTHAREEHFASDYAAAQRRALGLSALLTILGAGKDVVNVAAITNDVLLGTKFSRRSETRADEGGFKLMVRAGYDPNGMVKVFETLSKATGGGGMPEWASTHPADKNRIKNVQKWMANDTKKGVKYSSSTPLPVLPKTPAKAKDDKKGGKGTTAFRAPRCSCFG